MSAARRAVPVLLIAAGAVAVVAVSAAFLRAPSGPRLRVTGAYVPAPASPDVAAAYFTITDAGDTADELTGVTSDAGQAMAHRTTGGRMVMAERVPVSAHGRLVFAPGGYHVMIEHPVRRLRPGDRVTLTLEFRRSAPITVRAPVEPIGWRPGDG